MYSFGRVVINLQQSVIEVAKKNCTDIIIQFTLFICRKREFEMLVSVMQLMIDTVIVNYHQVVIKFDGLLPSFLRNIVEKAPGLS